MKAQEWARQEMNKQSGLPKLMLALLGTIAAGTLLAAITGPVVALVALIPTFGLLAFPLFRHFTTDDKLHYKRWRLAERAFHALIKQSDELLEEAVSEREQLVGLLAFSTMEEKQKSEIRNAADANIWRLVTLRIDAPAALGMTVPQANDAQQQSLRWLNRARELVEAAAATSLPPAEGDELIQRLAKEANAREEALRELLQVTG